MKQRLTLILIGALISCIYYLLNSHDLLEDIFPGGEIPISDPAVGASTESVNDGRDIDSSKQDLQSINIKSEGSTLLNSNVEFDEGNSGQGKRLEIFGIVVDEHGQPIANTLVAEQRKFYSTRTDLAGKYKIFFDRNGKPNPVLRFLRNGFKDKRIEFKAGELKNQSAIELNVVLEGALESISVDGWIGNDIGVGLGGLKIQLTARDSRGMDIVFHTVFSDERGNFSFEGIMSGDFYRLTVFSTPEYLFYVDEAFSVTQNTSYINIILESLKFVDVGGMIVNSSGVPIPDFEIYIRNVSTGVHVKKIVSDSSGFFNLRNFPAGEVSLSTQGPDYLKITGLTLAANEYRNLRLVIDKGNHYLSGWVSDDNGAPLANVMVKLNAKIQEGQIEHTSYRVKGTDSNGKFFFDDLGSGAHLITVEGFGFTKNEFMHRFGSQTDEIHITLSRK